MNINTPMKIIVAVIAIVVMGVLFYLFDWQAKQKDIASYDQQLVELSQKLEQHKDMVKELPVLTKRKADLEAELAQVVQNNLVPEKAEMFVANYISEIEKLTNDERLKTGDASFDIISITPGALTSQAPEKGSNEEAAAAEADANQEQTPDALKQFPTRMFQMTMKGQYKTLIEFLYELGDLRLERLVTINKLSLAPDGNDKDTLDSPTLTISIPITAYMRQGG